MIKIVVSSFYNTLINKEEAIPLSTMLEIERIRKQGIVFSVCTNNLLSDVMYYNKDFPFIDYAIALNGSYVYDVKKDKCLYQKKIPITTIKKIRKILSDYKLNFYTEKELLEDSDNLKKDIFKITVEVTKNKIPLEELETLDLNYSYLKLNNKLYLELTSNKTNNLKALEVILNTKKIALTETLLIAGNEADIPLIENIPNNYLVSNSPTSIKKLGTNKTKSNDLKGVEEVLKRI